MKAFLNPLLLTVCILLMVSDYVSAAVGDEAVPVLDSWVLTLCLLGVVINGTLGVARGLTQRSSALPCLSWSVAFLLLGCIVWSFVSGPEPERISSQERALLRERVDSWRAGILDPFTLDENGDGIATLAASLGEEELLAEVLADAAAVQTHAEVLVRAVHRAAERNREQVLRQLLAAGVPVDARLEGLTPLHAAALGQARESAACLLEQGAAVNAGVEDDGATPLHQAVLADDEEMVLLLLRHGADPHLPDAAGRDAASYARTEGIIEALSPAPPQPGAAEEP